jgi:hypothetical protein
MLWISGLEMSCAISSTLFSGDWHPSLKKMWHVSQIRYRISAFCYTHRCFECKHDRHCYPRWICSVESLFTFIYWLMCIFFGVERRNCRRRCILSESGIRFWRFSYHYPTYLSGRTFVILFLYKLYKDVICHTLSFTWTREQWGTWRILAFCVKCQNHHLNFLMCWIESKVARILTANAESSAYMTNIFETGNDALFTEFLSN